MANATQLQTNGVVYDIKDPTAYKSITAFYGADTSKYVTYNYTTKVITLPAGFVVYKGRAMARANQQQIDLTNLLVAEACSFWVKSDSTIVATAYSGNPPSDEYEFVGYLFRKSVWLNGIPESQIRVTVDGVIVTPYDNLSGSFIGIELEVRKVVYNRTTNELTLPGGFKVYRGSTSAYSAETIALPSTTSNKIWMQSDKTIYAKAWNDNSVNNANDDCIGFVYGTTVKINGVPEACVSIVQNNKETLGVFYGDAYVCINSSQEVVYDTVNGTLSLPAGFSVYRGMGKARAAVTVDVSGFTYGAGIIYMKNNYTFYARQWDSDVFEKPDDEIVGVIWGPNIWLNGVTPDRISIITSTSSVYCFGDSITAGTGTTKAYHMYLHDWYRNAILYNYGIGSTGFVYETSDTVTVGGGVVGIGSSHKENGNNSILKVMQSVGSSMGNIIIAAGTNDYGTSQTLASFRTAVQNALEYAISITPNVLVITPIKRNGWATSRNSQNLLLKDYVDVIIEECESRGIAYAEGFDVSIDPTNSTSKTAFAPDGLHPNAAGHRRMARSVFAKFLEAMNI